ncbi:DNA (cytosine-5-)-methyltransferase, partial [Campylobacter jejuni]|nr:DNA (cytosine-5-)-methyltransferase [Campylobacter jejuni]
ANSTFVAHIESDKYACETLKTRTSYWKLKKNNNLNIYYDYLLKKITKEQLWELTNTSDSEEVICKEISEHNFDSLVSKIKNNLKKTLSKNIDVIIGGPPCQAYSIIGRARMKNSIENDHRNYLYKYYVKFLNIFKPKIFVFENVPGIKSAGNGKYFDDLKKSIEDIGYSIQIKELIASDFGVLQNRKRIIIVGFKIKKNKKYSYPIFEKIENKNYFVKDVLSDLPKINPGEKIEGLNKYTKKTNSYLKMANIRDANFNILTQHETRPHNDRDREIYKEAILAWNTKRERLCYKKLALTRPELISHKNTNSFTNRFNVIKENTNASHTILAHMAMDGHYYIHPDITQLRSLSIREAARLQSFPDDFYFEGPRTSIFRQIGNAVPPKMAEQIAKKIKELII